MPGPAVVPERTKKRVQALEARKALAAANQEKHNQELGVLKKAWIAKGEQYEKYYNETKRQGIIANRKAKAEGAFFVPAESKVALVVRIRGINKHSPKVVRIMRLLRLRQLNNAVFVRLNKASINILRRVQPFIMYGYPSVQTVRKLILKRGHLKLNNQRIPITTNEVITALSKKQPALKNVTCVEDVVHEITTCGPNFKQVNNSLWPFKLRNPRGGFKAKRHPFHRGGDWGNREDLINEVVQKML